MSRLLVQRSRPGRKFSRRPGTLVGKPTLLIVCEGETEQLYFETLKLKLRLPSVQIPRDSVGRDPSQLVAYAEKLMKENGGFDHVACVFDRDDHHHFENARTRIRSIASRKMRSKVNIFEAVTIPAFEFWILLHFERTATPFTNSNEVIRHLESRGHVAQYIKTDQNLHLRLIELYGSAVRNSLWLAQRAETDGFECPFCNVHKVVILMEEIASTEIPYRA